MNKFPKKVIFDVLANIFDVFENMNDVLINIFEDVKNEIARRKDENKIARRKDENRLGETGEKIPDKKKKIFFLEEEVG